MPLDIYSSTNCIFLVHATFSMLLNFQKLLNYIYVTPVVTSLHIKGIV